MGTVPRLRCAPLPGLEARGLGLEKCSAGGQLLSLPQPPAPRLQPPALLYSRLRMQTGSTAHTQAPYPPQDAIVRIGSWLFKQRSWLPVPIALVLLLTPASTGSPLMLAVGVCLVAAGESLRLWAVHQIGTISRTRSQRVGPLIATGPFGLVRNPLYLGNIALWLGFALSARLPWAAPVVLLLLAAEYHAIVKWEEGLLAVRLGDPYRTYLSQVPRWFPSFRNSTHSRGSIRSKAPTRGGKRSSASAARSSPSPSAIVAGHEERDGEPGAGCWGLGGLRPRISTPSSGPSPQPPVPATRPS